MSVIAVDFGGTRSKAGVVAGGVAREVRVLETPGHGSLERMLPALREWCAGVAAAGGEPVEALVWALPCVIAPGGCSVVRTFGKFDDAPGLDLAGWARQSLGLPLVLENDARAAVLGEWQGGAGRGCDHLVMVTLGTGIGTAVVSGGRPLRGSNGSAGILGAHSVAAGGGRACVCGLSGCAEAEAGSWALPAIARESPRFGASALSREAVVDYRAVFRHAAAGDRLAVELRERALAVWERLLVALVQQFDPQRVVLGGGVMAAGDEILPRLRERLDGYAAARGIRIELRRAELGDAAALVGCGWLWTSRGGGDDGGRAV